MTQSGQPELNPEDAMAVDSTPDEVRLHGDVDETETVQRNDGAIAPVDADADEDDQS